MAVSITWFCERFQPHSYQPDVDNIAKPIVDALKELVYDDDARVTDVLCRRRSSANMPKGGDLTELLIKCLSHHSDSVHIVVDGAPISEVHLLWKM